MSFCWNKFHTSSKSLIIVLCSSSLFFLSLWDDIATKFLHAAGFLSALYFFTAPRKTLTQNPALLIFISLSLLGIIDILWYWHYKVSGTVYTNAYRGPMETGKIALCSAFIFLVLFAKDQVMIKFNFQKLILFSSLATQVFFFAHAMWQHFYLNVDRVALSASHATTAGYLILFPALLAAILILKSDLRHKTTFYTINFTLSLCAVIVTETRAAILVFPTFSVLLILMDSFLNKRINYKLYCFIGVALLAGVFIFKDTLLMRLNDLNNDLVSYSHDNTITSVGARLAMYEAGLKTYSPVGQSLEERANKIHELEIKEPRLSGALPFVDSHLHNDLIDTLSTRGIPGVLLTILVFSSILIYALRTAREPYILILLFAILVTGLSDVILFSKPVPTALFVTLILLCSYFQTQKIRK
ncbi:O-antigen ligase family protein [Escherichia ruysiae]|uniref:O-antigen ligase family protein n=1 Tax=Escherichia ruysiae TaxID=2608867 RepID=UPI001583D9D6|nr:O-antigen ligase family protein [Escherichia ruysiae]MBY7190224.1 O-antigen ligase family protein [Escherichia ruysiae]MBY7280050.1 O-antigen ligase family protein [Escherichia ruysiae]